MGTCNLNSSGQTGAEPVSGEEMEIRVDNDRESPVYAVGEDISFPVNSSAAPENLEYCVWGEDGTAVSGGRFLSGKTPVIHTRAGRPGFIQVGVRPAGSAGQYVFAGAAVEPGKLVMDTPMPADFQEFWQAQADQVRNAPFEVEYCELQNPEQLLYPGRIGCREVSVRSRSGLCATGFLASPVRAAPGSLPIILSFNGASKIIAELKPAQDWAANAALSFNLNFHGLPNQISPEAFAERRKQLDGYQWRNADSPDDYEMKNIFLRVVLALEYLKSHPLWNGRDLIVCGGSLGGCQALVAAALDSRVTLCVAQADAMCNHCGRPAGWPGLLETVPEARKAAPYFDAGNFASLVQCRTVMSVGLIDRCCPPASTYSAYNGVPAENKKMYMVCKGEHGGSSPDGKGVYWYGSEEIKEICKEAEEMKHE